MMRRTSVPTPPYRYGSALPVRHPCALYPNGIIWRRAINQIPIHTMPAGRRRAAEGTAS